MKTTAAEIESAEVTQEHVAEALSRGMARYTDGPRDSLAAMGTCLASLLNSFFSVPRSLPSEGLLTFRCCVLA